MRLVAEGLSATRGEDLIFRDIAFEIAGGEALVVKGPNGSGKSTLLRVLAGLLPARSGSAMRAGCPIRFCLTCVTSGRPIPAEGKPHVDSGPLCQNVGAQRKSRRQIPSTTLAMLK